jgi:hypothetical protein
MASLAGARQYNLICTAPVGKHQATANVHIGGSARSLGPDPSLSVMSSIGLAHADRRPVDGNAEVEVPVASHRVV